MLSKITFENFLDFREKLVIDDIPQINVIIGENDTGKTSIIKLFYSASKSLEEFYLKKNIPFKKVLSEKLMNVFQPKKNSIGEIVTKGEVGKFSCEATFKSPTMQNIFFSFGQSTTNTINDCSEHIDNSSISHSALFIPAKEVLTAFDAIAATRENLFMNGFDDTYLDLIRALRIKTQQGRVATELNKINIELASLFEGEIIHNEKDSTFIFKKNKFEYSMSTTAEGIKKIGILTTLIRNRQLGKNTILFMDEPETALHPRAIRKLAFMLYDMSRAGVQIFLTTHSYFLIKQLSIIAKKENFRMGCISLRKSNGQVVADISELQNGLPKNPIIDEAIAMYEEEIEADIVR